MPVYINTRKYECAQVAISGGYWRADAEDGLLYGRRGKPFSGVRDGYVYAELPAAVSPPHVQVYVHRVLWEYANGLLPGHLEINHRDLDRSNNCSFNLEVVTRLGNQHHAIAAGAWTPAHGEDHGMAKLSNDQVGEIYRRAWAGELHASIAGDFGVHPNHVKAIKHQRVWAQFTSTLEVSKANRSHASRLVAEDIVAIRNAVASGEQQKIVAARFGVAQSTMSQIVSRKLWTHV